MAKKEESELVVQKEISAFDWCIWFDLREQGGVRCGHLACCCSQLCGGRNMQSGRSSAWLQQLLRQKDGKGEIWQDPLSRERERERMLQSMSARCLTNSLTSSTSSASTTFIGHHSKQFRADSRDEVDHALYIPSSCTADFTDSHRLYATHSSTCRARFGQIVNYWCFCCCCCCACAMIVLFLLFTVSPSLRMRNR